MRDYMVIEMFKEDALEAVYERFHSQGRLLPEGLIYINSWLANDGRQCFQLMKTDDYSLFAQWTKHWSDLADFQIIALRDKPEATT